MRSLGIKEIINFLTVLSRYRYKITQASCMIPHCDTSISTVFMQRLLLFLYILFLDYYDDYYYGYDEYDYYGGYAPPPPMRGRGRGMGMPPVSPLFKT